MMSMSAPAPTRLSRLFCGVLVAMMLLVMPVNAKTILNVVGHWAVGPQQKMFMDLTQEYTKQNPDIEIQYIQAPMDKFEGVAKVASMIAGGMAPDIIHSYLAITPEFMLSGAFAPMPAQVAGEAQKFYLKPLVDGVTYNGRMYGFPTQNQTYTLAYNERLFSEAGIGSAPKNWQALQQTAAKLTKVESDGKVSRYGFTFANEYIAFAHGFLTLLWGNAGEYVDQNGRVRLNEPPAMQVLQYLSDMATSNTMSVTGNTAAFRDAKAAMAIAAPWWRNGLSASNAIHFEDIHTTLVPNTAGPKTSFQYGWAWFVAAQGKQQDEAWRFLRWYNTVRKSSGMTSMGELAQFLGSLPLSRLDLQREDFRKVPFYGGFVESLEVARSEPLLPVTTQRQQVLAQTLIPAITGKMAIGSALEEAQRQISTMLADARK